MKKYILGLDLGITSIGWALILEDEDKKNTIVDIGSRIIPLSVDDKDEFSKGNAISKNQKRTLRRTQRKGYDRYQLRRKDLKELLVKLNMFPSEELMKLSSLSLYGLRNKGISEKIELQELGRVLYHLNQKRGYKSSRSDANLDKKDTDYVAEVKNRHQLIKEAGNTIGQHFFIELKKINFLQLKNKSFQEKLMWKNFMQFVKNRKNSIPF
jgi:CRISPR-associated endonuclease Csn1